MLPLPRELNDDPETWPEQPGTDAVTEAVRRIARSHPRALADRKLSLRAALALPTAAQWARRVRRPGSPLTGSAR
ncbi:hypothetical protein [Streptomyces sp. NBC_00829]|uniref:hypothetical protein n=1 Tax=Streptomyces sp. NBC_00829 TaxID=2903679 RepID=UPI0038645B9F|nr:hypothetical protein OG293_37375 [Streptomyces sp. NBC_00829]